MTNDLKNYVKNSLKRARFRFESARSKIETEIKKRKKKFYCKKIKICIGDSRKVYKLLNDLKGITNTSSRTIVSVHGKSGDVNSDKLAVANEFEDFFSSIGSHLANQIPKLESDQLYSEPRFCKRLNSITECEVEVIFSALQNKLSSGKDGISNLIAQAKSFAIVPFLKKLIELSFKSQCFPTALAQAVVYPLYKAGSKLDVSNNRPILLLVTWSKVFERAMYNRMYSYLEANSLIYIKQFVSEKNTVLWMLLPK